MKKSTICSTILAFSLFLTSANFAKAEANTPDQSSCATSTSYTPASVSIVGVEQNSPEATKLVNLYNNLVKASNDHDINEILSFYNPSYISGDNLTLTQMKSMIEDTWKAYPGICYTSKPLEIRVDGKWATIESLDHSSAVAPPEKDVITTPGTMTSDSRNLIYLKQMGNSWEIMSDATLWEEAVVNYGIPDSVKISLDTPEQVKAGKTYTASVKANVPDGTFAIATIDNQPTTYPEPKPDDKFRTLTGDDYNLQRVLTANTLNHNEIVTATIGLTNVEQTNPERPTLSLNGIETIVKRVNVVPLSAEDVITDLKKREIVKTSADGKINLNGRPGIIENTSSIEIEPDPYAGEESAPDDTDQAPTDDQNSPQKENNAAPTSPGK